MRWQPPPAAAAGTPPSRPSSLLMKSQTSNNMILSCSHLHSIAVFGWLLLLIYGCLPLAGRRRMRWQPPPAAAAGTPPSRPSSLGQAARPSSPCRGPPAATRSTWSCPPPPRPLRGRGRSAAGAGTSWRGVFTASRVCACMALFRLLCALRVHDLALCGGPEVGGSWVWAMHPPAHSIGRPCRLVWQPLCPYSLRPRP